MSEADAFSKELHRLLREALDSAESVAVLRLVHRDPARTWSVAALAAAAHISTDAARRACERLCGRGLFEVRITDDLYYRYSPLHEDLRDAVEAYLATDAAPRAASRNALSDFADAFRLRKEKKNE